MSLALCMYVALRLRQLAATCRKLQNTWFHHCVTTVIRHPQRFLILYLMNTHHHSACTCSLRNDLPFAVPIDFLVRFHWNIYNPFTLSGFHFDGIRIRRDEFLQWSGRNTSHSIFHAACRTWQECWNIRKYNSFQWIPIPCSDTSFDFRIGSECQNQKSKTFACFGRKFAVFSQNIYLFAEFPSIFFAPEMLFKGANVLLFLKSKKQTCCLKKPKKTLL